MNQKVDEQLDGVDFQQQPQKSVVSFGEIMGWSDRGEYGVTAALLDVQNHPRLGTVPQVFTSQVVAIRYNAFRQVCEIETLNTIYKRIE